jgi:hypothetical protein
MSRSHSGTNVPESLKFGVVRAEDSSVSDRSKARLVAAGTSTFLSLLVAAALLLAVGVLSGRLSAPTLPGPSEVRIALPALSDTTTPPVTGPGAIPPELLTPDDGPGGDDPGDGGGGPGPQEPGPTPPREEAPAVGARVGSEDVGGLGLVSANVPITIGDASGETTTTSIDLLGVHVDVETSDNLVEDVLCLLLCSP